MISPEPTREPVPLRPQLGVSPHTIPFPPLSGLNLQSPLNCRDVCAVVAGWVLDYGLCKGVVQCSAALSGLRVEIRGAMALEEPPLEAVAINVQV